MNSSSSSSIVYCHLLDGNPFYIGIGEESRAYNFTSRSLKWKNYVGERSSSIQVHILFSSLSLDCALSLEAHLIKTLSRFYPLCNIEMGEKQLKMELNNIPTSIEKIRIQYELMKKNLADFEPYIAYMNNLKTIIDNNKDSQNVLLSQEEGWVSLYSFCKGLQSAGLCLSSAAVQQQIDITLRSLLEIGKVNYHDRQWIKSEDGKVINYKVYRKEALWEIWTGNKEKWCDLRRPKWDKFSR